MILSTSLDIGPLRSDNFEVFKITLRAFEIVSRGHTALKTFEQKH